MVKIFWMFDSASGKASHLKHYYIYHLQSFYFMEKEAYTQQSGVQAEPINHKHSHLLLLSVRAYKTPKKFCLRYFWHNIIIIIFIIIYWSILCHSSFLLKEFFFLQECELCEYLQSQSFLFILLRYYTIYEIKLEM